MENVIARKGFFPAVIGRDVQVREAGGVVVVARRNLSVERGGGQWLVALGDQSIHQGGGAVLISREACVTNGLVGVLVAGRATLEGSARALVTVPAPLALAAAAGFAAGVLFGLGRRRRRS